MVAQLVLNVELVVTQLVPDAELMVLNLELLVTQLVHDSDIMVTQLVPDFWQYNLYRIKNSW